ncbi:hypothetical protein JHK87_042882 [Glycine soja]|nr:hypothetical protein JHK87_042882 [Glycine soja]
MPHCPKKCHNHFLVRIYSSHELKKYLRYRRQLSVEEYSFLSFSLHLLFLPLLLFRSTTLRDVPIIIPGDTPRTWVAVVIDLHGGSLSTVSTGAQAIPGHSTRDDVFYQFTQQNLPACKPVLTPAVVIATLLLMGFIFIPVGLVALRA